MVTFEVLVKDVDVTVIGASVGFSMIRVCIVVDVGTLTAMKHEESRISINGRNIAFFMKAIITRTIIYEKT